jgi:hypothetical protein
MGWTEPERQTLISGAAHGETTMPSSRRFIALAGSRVPGSTTRGTPSPSLDAKSISMLLLLGSVMVSFRSSK